MPVSFICQYLCKYKNENVQAKVLQGLGCQDLPKAVSSVNISRVWQEDRRVLLWKWDPAFWGTQQGQAP